MLAYFKWQLTLLVTIGLTGLMTLFLATLMSKQFEQVKTIKVFADKLDIENQIVRTFSNKQTCTCNLSPNGSIGVNFKNSLYFNSNNNGASLTIPYLRENCNNWSLSQYPPFLEAGKPFNSTFDTNIGIQSLSISNIEASSTKKLFSAYIKVSFEKPSSNSQIQLKDIFIPLQFKADITNPNAAYITECGGVGYSNDSPPISKFNCPKDQLVAGFDKNGQPYCEKPTISVPGPARSELIYGTYQVNRADGSCHKVNSFTNICKCPKGSAALYIGQGILGSIEFDIFDCRLSPI